MRKLILSFLILASLAEAVFAQPETFDIARFAAPPGWKRADSAGIVRFDNSVVRNGRTSTCQIYLFPSRASTATPEANFQAEWNDKVVRPLGVVNGKPTPPTQKTADGWTALMASVDLLQQGVPFRTILFSATGSGRVMSVVVNMSGDAFQPEVQSFFGSLSFKVDGVSQAPARPGATQGASTSASGSLAEYSFAVPSQWSRQDSRDAIVLASQVYGNGEQCRINMLPMRPVSRGLPEDALNIFRDIFKTDPLSFYPYPWPKLSRGFSPQGWEYFVVKKAVGGRDGDANLVGTTLLVAKLGDQLATVVATSKESLVSNCFGELVRDLWPQFFYSLQFKNAKPSGQEEAALKQRLAGAWITATASVGLRYQFLANGRYADAAAAQQYNRINSTEVLQTTQAYFGDGAYSFEGNTIVLTGDDKRRSTKLFRLDQESKDGGKSWMDKLCMLDPGSTGEVCYERTQ